MKNKLFFIILIGLLTISCKKNQSTISGTAWYSDSLGNTTKAPNIELQLRSDGIPGPIEMTTMTNGNGEYMFVDVTDGHHWMTAEVNNNGHTYTYGSDIIYTEKEDPVQIDPVLKW